jgi:hypothetical protein
VVEDVDLIAEQRVPHRGQHPLLFQLLNEMDGLGEDANVTFLLTTNRADMLESALAARPGRVDHAAELPLPDAGARRKLIRLYQGSLVVDLADPEMVISRTEGVTASFLKELLRRAALNAAQDEESGDAPSDRPLRVTDAHMSAALDRLLDTRPGGARRPPAAGHRPSCPLAGQRSRISIASVRSQPRPPIAPAPEAGTSQGRTRYKSARARHGVTDPGTVARRAAAGPQCLGVRGNGRAAAAFGRW